MSLLTEFIENEAIKLSKELDLIYVDCEYVKKHDGMNLNIFVDKKDGIGLDELEPFSRKISDLLDQNENLFKDSYTLNVSSPGLDRQFKKSIDFELALGKEVEIKFYTPQPPSNKKVQNGILKEFNDNSVTITTGNETELITIARKNIASISKTIKF